MSDSFLNRLFSFFSNSTYSNSSVLPLTTKDTLTVNVNTNSNSNLTKKYNLRPRKPVSYTV